MVARVDSWLPRQSLETVRGQARLVGDTLVGFVHGQALICLILAIYYGIALSLAGLASGLALGLLIGVLAIIPMLGVATGFILAIGLAASQYGTWTAILTVGGIFVIGQLAEANFLTPKLLGDRVHLHPVWVIFALFAGGTLYGFVGVLVAVPVAAVIGVIARFALSRYRRSSLYDSHAGRGRGRVCSNLTRIQMTQLLIGLHAQPGIRPRRFSRLALQLPPRSRTGRALWPDWLALVLVLPRTGGVRGESPRPFVARAHRWRPGSGRCVVANGPE